MCRDWKLQKCNHHFPELNKKTRIIKTIFKFFNSEKMSLVAIALVFIIGAVYLMQINITSTNGYKIKELENRLNQLKADNKKLNLSYIELQSMAKVMAEVPNLNLVVSDKIEIITPAGSAVAMR